MRWDGGSEYPEKKWLTILQNENKDFGAQVMGCKDLGVQALWEYVYGPSGIGPVAPWGLGTPIIVFFCLRGSPGLEVRD